MYPDVPRSLPVMGSSARARGQPRGLEVQSPVVVKYLA
jgi:hypothetical protein